MSGSRDVRYPRRPAVFRLIVRQGIEQEEVFTLDLDDEGEALPVFSFEDEARMFLSLGALGDGWRLRKTMAGELKEMLMGSLAGVEFVSLDPLPELVYRRMISLVSVRREQFVDGFVSSLIENEEQMKPLVG